MTEREADLRIRQDVRRIDRAAITIQKALDRIAERLWAMAPARQESMQAEVFRGRDAVLAVNGFAYRLTEEVRHWRTDANDPV